MTQRGMKLVGAVGIVACVCCCAAVQALGLPPGRVDEMVSPLYKAGYGVNVTTAVAPDGESVAFASTGVFAGQLLNDPLGNLYVARRSTLQWSNTSVAPPAALAPVGFTADFSETLDSALFKGFPGPSVALATLAGTENVFFLHDTNTDMGQGWEVAGLRLETVNKDPFNANYGGASGDLCHILIDGVGADPLLSVAVGATAEQVYEMARGCNGEPPSLRVVALDNKGAVIDLDCNAMVGARLVDVGEDGKAATFNAISADGSEVFFTSKVNPGEGQHCESQFHNPNELFLRLAGSKTLELSRPLGDCVGEAGEEPEEVPCKGAVDRAPAYFQGANEKGTVAFFTTAEPLAGTDTDTGNDLYTETIGCPGGPESQCEADQRGVTSLVQVSHAAEPAEVQGVVRVAPDGSRVYFVARGVIAAESPSGEGVQPGPVAGADNLYVYDVASGNVSFVADLCSGFLVSGQGEDQRCPPDEGIAAPRSDLPLWVGHEPEAQSTADGGVLVFSSFGRLAENDTDNAKDVYRYDAVTGALERVSVGEAGHDANGNRHDSAGEPRFGDAAIVPGHVSEAPKVTRQHELDSRAISGDGSRIVFETAEPLSGAANNGVTDVYEWHDGGVSLISGGTSLTADCCAVMSSSGRDVFFTTSQGLLAQDTDGAADIYDARIGGGFAPAPAPRQPCSGDACQGPLTNPAALLVPGSIVQAPGQNIAAPVPKHARPAKKTVRAKKKARHKKKKANGRSGSALKASGRSTR
jgi:hypothetical protein